MQQQGGGQGQQVEGRVLVGEGRGIDKENY